MKTLITLMMLMTALVSCRNDSGVERPRLADQEQLSPTFIVVEIDGKKYIDMDKSVCNARMYEISRSQVGPSSKPQKYHIMECNKIVGRALDEYKLFAEFLEDFRNWLLGFK